LNKLLNTTILESNYFGVNKKMKKEILILISVLFFAGTITAFNSIEKTKGIPATETEMDETRGLNYNLCTGEMTPSWDDNGDLMWFYGGDIITEEPGTCNSRVRQYYPDGEIDMNLATWASQNDVQRFSGLTFPEWAWRIGKYVEKDFNWSKDTNYCFVETYTTRHKTGQQFPLMHDSGIPFDNSGILTWLYEYLGNNNWDELDYQKVRPEVINLNSPLIDFTTDRQDYTLPEGQETIPMTLTMTDDDLLCGKPNWFLAAGAEYQSSETFEVVIDGQALDSTQPNSGAFGVNLTQGNQGEITFDWNAIAYTPGEYDLNITVTDTDGYHQRIGSGFGAEIGPFIVEEFGTPITKTIHLTVEGQPQAFCGDIDGSGSPEINIADLVYLVDYMFNQGPTPVPLWVANVDGLFGDEINIADLVYLVDYMFNQGPAPTCGR
ncbi:MAG: hypothetical protein ABIA04_09685, partial [Pseudomonadota bacterium]